MSIDKSGIDDDDVVSMNPQFSLIGTQVFKFSQFTEGLTRSLYSSFNKDSAAWDNFLRYGVECEQLPASTGGWRKGKLWIRIQVEFIPDVPDEPAPDDDQTTSTGV